MNNRRRSIIWQVSQDQFLDFVHRSHSITELLACFGLRNIGANHKTVKKRLCENRIDFSHFKRGQTINKGKKGPLKGLSRQECLEKIFVENSLTCKTVVRRYLKRYNLIERKCRDCNLTDIWNGKPLTLQLEHINGDSTDDRLKNLCWLCPNCHSQTPTYTGKAKKRYSKLKLADIDPNWRKTIMIPFIKKCPLSKEDLNSRIWATPFDTLTKELQTTEKTLRRWSKEYEITFPPRGYWQRRQNGWTHEEALKPWPKGKENPPKFNAKQIIEIREKLKNGERPAKLAREYGCCHKTMRDIRDNKGYKWVIDETSIYDPSTHRF